jgi:hypothetical protein
LKQCWLEQQARSNRFAEMQRALARVYLGPRVGRLARDLEDPEIERFHRECLRRAGPPQSAGA